VAGFRRWSFFTISAEQSSGGAAVQNKHRRDIVYMHIYIYIYIPYIPPVTAILYTVHIILTRVYVYIYNIYSVFDSPEGHRHVIYDRISRAHTHTHTYYILTV